MFRVFCISPFRAGAYIPDFVADILSNQNNTSSIETNSLGQLQWVTNYADYLYNYVSTRINDKEAATDLVRQTFGSP